MKLFHHVLLVKSLDKRAKEISSYSSFDVWHLISPCQNLICQISWQFDQDIHNIINLDQLCSKFNNVIINQHTKPNEVIIFPIYFVGTVAQFITGSFVFTEFIYMVHIITTCTMLVWGDFPLMYVFCLPFFYKARLSQITYLILLPFEK